MLSMDEPRRANAPMIAFLVILFGLLATYVTGYFVLSRKMPGPVSESACRVFRQKWQTEVYKPATKVEGVLTGETIEPYWQP